MEIVNDIKSVKKVVNRFSMMIEEIEEGIRYLEGIEDKTERQDGKLSVLYHLRRFYTDTFDNE